MEVEYECRRVTANCYRWATFDKWHIFLYYKNYIKYEIDLTVVCRFIVNELSSRNEEYKDQQLKEKWRKIIENIISPPEEAKDRVLFNTTSI